MRVTPRKTARDIFSPAYAELFFSWLPVNLPRNKIQSDQARRNELAHSLFTALYFLSFETCRLRLYFSLKRRRVSLPMLPRGFRPSSLRFRSPGPPNRGPSPSTEQRLNALRAILVFSYDLDHVGRRRSRPRHPGDLIYPIYRFSRFFVPVPRRPGANLFHSQPSRREKTATNRFHF